MAGGEIGAEELAELLGVLPDFVALVGRDRRLRFVNRSEEGYDAGEVVGADLMEFVAPEIRERQEEVFARVLRTAEPETFEVPVLDAAGERQWYEGTLTPLLRDSAVAMVAMVTRNVTERHRAREEAARLRRLLPVCSWCGRLRGEDGEWRTLEAHVEEAGDTRVTHGMCPECVGTVGEGARGA